MVLCSPPFYHSKIYKSKFLKAVSFKSVCVFVPSKDVCAFLRSKCAFTSSNYIDIDNVLYFDTSLQLRIGYLKSSALISDPEWDFLFSLGVTSTLLYFEIELERACLSLPWLLYHH